MQGIDGRVGDGRVGDNQGSADMKFLPDANIRYVYNLKSDTQYQYRYLI